MRGHDYWYGKEVEGRLYGLWTMICRHKVGPINSKVKHLYFTIEFWGVEDCLEIFEDAILNHTVSIEVDEYVYDRIPSNVKVRAHLIYRIKDKNVFDLKETDSVFVDGESYNVLCFTKHNALKVGYDDYSNDIL